MQVTKFTNKKQQFSFYLYKSISNNALGKDFKLKKLSFLMKNCWLRHAHRLPISYNI